MKSKEEILLSNGFDILENGCCYTDKHRIERVMKEYADQQIAYKEKERLYWQQLAEAAIRVINCIPDRAENLYELGFHKALKEYEQLKDQKQKEE